MAGMALAVAGRVGRARGGVGIDCAAAIDYAAAA